jgi:hypothetical protein
MLRRRSALHTVAIALVTNVVARRKAGKSEKVFTECSFSRPVCTLDLAAGVLPLPMQTPPASQAPAGGAGGAADNPHSHVASSHRSEGGDLFLPGVASPTAAGGVAPNKEPPGARRRGVSILLRCALLLTQHLSCETRLNVSIRRRRSATAGRAAAARPVRALRQSVRHTLS